MSKKKKKHEPISSDQFKKTWSYVVPHFMEYKKRLFIVVVLSMLAASFEPSIAYSVKPSVKYLFREPERGLEILWLLPVAIIGGFFLRGLFNFTYKYLLEKVCLQVVRKIQVSLYEHYLYLSLDHYERTTTGEMMSRTVNDVAHMHRIVPMVIEAGQQVFSLIGLIAVSFFMEPVLSVLAFVSFPVVIYSVQNISTRMRRYAKRGLKQAAVINTKMAETYSGIKVVKAFAMERAEVSIYRVIMDKMNLIQYKYAAVKHLTSPLVGFLGSIGVALIATIACYRILKQAQHAPDAVDNLLAYLAAVGLMFNPVKKLGDVVAHFSGAYGAAERIQETFEKQSTVVEDPEAVEISPMQNEIRYENVFFKYTDETVLENFNLMARKGQLIALVGTSGSGKSTVVNLLPRFYDVTEGVITIDGFDIRKATFNSLRRQIGVVTQETFLFDGTVASNILYGSEDKTIEDVIKVAKAAKVHDFVQKLPKGYDTEIGERGVRLSGGERQRIAIARALLKDPPILLLDEATSALDTAAEREVQAALDSLMAHRTTIAIAHRLSTITHADKIVVIKKGCIVEEGTHEELMKRDGEYKRLYEMQFFLGEYSTDHYRARQRPGQAEKPA